MKNKNMRLPLANSRELKFFFVLCVFFTATFKTSPTSADNLLYPSQVAQEPKKRDYSEFYKIKNYIKGVHYSSRGHPVKKHPNNKEEFGFGIENFFQVSTVLLPDGTNAWQRIVSHQLRKRGFSKKQISRYSFLRENTTDIHSKWSYKERRKRLKECYPSNLKKYITRKGKRILNNTCGILGSLPTEYNVETGKFLGLDPYQFAKNLPQCFSKDEKTCNIKYPSFKIQEYQHFKQGLLPCKLTPGQIKYCRKYEFKNKTRYKGYYDCSKLKAGEYYGESDCPYVKKVNYKSNLAFGCHSIAVSMRIDACGPIANFEPPGVAMKSKVTFKPPANEPTIKKYRIGPGHYCPPPDDIYPCDGRDSNKRLYIVE